jgi:outer membrane lipoprotein-sorting protein
MRSSILASACRVLALILACGVSSGSAAETESKDGLTARQILDKMATTYAACQSYRDSGVVTNFFDPEHIDIKPFHTAFARPDQFRFEYNDDAPEKAYIVWARGDEVRTWWYITPGVKSPGSLGNGLAGATGVSSGSAHTIPVLLLPDRIGGRSMTSLTELVRLPDDTIDDTPCFKLQGKFADEPTTLWLEKETFLIRRIVEDSKLAKATTVYRPEVDKEISAAELEFQSAGQNLQTSPVITPLNSHALRAIGGGEIVLLLGMLLILAMAAVAFIGVIYLIFRAAQNPPSPDSSRLPPEAAIQNRQRRDREHLKLLSIFHFIFGGLALVGIAFLCVHYFIMHTLFSNTELWRSQKAALPPREFLDAFICSTCSWGSCC